MENINYDYNGTYVNDVGKSLGYIKKCIVLWTVKMVTT